MDFEVTPHAAPPIAFVPCPHFAAEEWQHCFLSLGAAASVAVLSAKNLGATLRLVSCTASSALPAVAGFWDVHRGLLHCVEQDNKLRVWDILSGVTSMKCLYGKCTGLHLFSSHVCDVYHRLLWRHVADSLRYWSTSFNTARCALFACTCRNMRSALGSKSWLSCS